MPAPNPCPEHLCAVVFDWRGTLVSELTPHGWAREALRRIDRDHSDAAVSTLLRDIRTAAGEPNRLQSPHGNTSYERHKETFDTVFADAGLDTCLAEELFAVDSDPAYNAFAADAADTIAALRDHGCKIGILSNIHFDIRPEFAAAGLLASIDAFVLSGERGIQKPDPAIFELMLKELDAPAEQTLMVGDRFTRDGAAAVIGMPTLLVPALTDPERRQLHLVTNTVGIRPSRSVRAVG
ncbi:HAD family hydrolase [Nocardia sp. NPDC006044]|uniref:HAD family hydrolase n=1 Tax=Nocardia sp. NPDC006044 TaxID=3364306 RepID=UPI0036C4CECD